jgi:hypothetical protein
MAPKKPMTEIRIGGFLTLFLAPLHSRSWLASSWRWPHLSQQLRLRGRELLVTQHAGRMEICQLLELIHIDPPGRNLRRSWCLLHHGLLLPRLHALFVSGLRLSLLLRFLIRILLLLVVLHRAGGTGNYGRGRSGANERHSSATHEHLKLSFSELSIFDDGS